MVRQFRLLGAAVLVLGVGALGACESPGLAPIESAIDSSVSESTTSVAEVNFDELVDGNWDQLFIVCPGATKRDLGQLAAATEQVADLSSPGFIGLLLFVRGDKVFDSLNVGQNVYLTTYFSPCPRLSPEPTYSIERADSNLRFSLNPEDSYWYPTLQ
ncbi:hypothetical protein BH11ACT5_BH11ACT5_07160 [soil metagenome]